MDIFTEKEKESSRGEMNETETKKFCANCKTTKTPLWRSGPAGPKSLCNACGIRFRKKKGDPVLGVNKGLSDRKKDKPSPSSSSSSSPTSAADVTANTTINSCGEKGNYEKTIVDQGKDGNMGGKLRVRLMGFGKEVVLLQRPRSPMKRRRRIGEVEQAAVLLMTLSYTSVYA